MHIGGAAHLQKDGLGKKALRGSRQVGRVFWSPRYPEHGSKRGAVAPGGLVALDGRGQGGNQLEEARGGHCNAQDPGQGLLLQV